MLNLLTLSDYMPKAVGVIGDSSEAVLMRVTQPSKTPVITVYKAKSGSSTCEAQVAETSPKCFLFGLASGARHMVEVVACVSSNFCSEPYVAWGYTYPKDDEQ